MSVMRTRRTSTSVLYLLIGALVVIVGGLGYYAYDQSQRSADVEIRLEVPTNSAN